MYAGAARTESSAAGAAVATEQRTPKAIRSTADPTRVPRWAIAREQQVLPLIDPRPLQFPGLQAKLRISQPGDDYEKEADQAADRIADAMARANGSSADLADPDDLASDELAGDDLDEVEGTEVAAPAGETVIQRKRRSANASHPRPYRSGSVALQRQTTGKDSSSEPAEDIRGDLLTIAEGAEEEELEEDVSVPAEGGLTGTLMRSERNDGERPVTGDRGALLSRTLTSPGEPLGENLRARLEAGFGRNLRPVRIHTDADAAASAEAVNARAYTVRHHVVFGAGEFRPHAPEGLRLLAHELTHVLQQTSATGHGTRLSRAPGRGSRKKGKGGLPPDRHTIGEVVVQKGDTLEDVIARAIVAYFKLDEKEARKIIRENIKQGKVAAPGKTMQIWLSQDVIDKIIAKLYAQPPKKGGTGTGDKNPPGAGGDTPPGEPGPAPQPGATPGEKPDTPPKEPGEPGKEGGERKKPLPPGATGQKGGAEPTGEEIKTREGGKKGGTGTGTEPGSKYGWLGWLKLPQDVIDALEAAFEALGDSEEYQALSELLNLLKDLGDYIDEVKSWFKDTDKLLAAVLGLEKSKTIDKLEEWVERPAKKRKATPGAKGIVGIALKVANIIEKIRRLLKPVFIARDAFIKVLGVVELVVEGVPALENLLSATKKELQTTSFRDLTVQVATDIAASLQAHLLDARKSFKLVLERFTKDDLISREMIASALTRAALKMVKHPVVKLASKIPGLDDLVSDNLVAPLIPDQALEAINGTIKEFAGDVIKTVRDAVKADLDKIFATSEQAITDFLIDHLPSLVAQPSAKAPAASRSAAGYAGQRAERLVQASTGGPLDGDLADAFASHLGYGVAHVRVHHNAASQEASELLQANAFTVGRDIYFGPGQFAPESSAGRRLLAHELMHVVQQDGSGADVQPGLVQRDFKGLQKKLVALFGDKVLDLLKVARAPSKKKEKRAGEIRDQIEKLRGRKVVSETNPALPEAYIYVTDKKKKKIKGIRRLLAWIRYVPPLTIKRNGRIELGGVFNAFDPKAAARAQLRRALGCRSTQEAHHVIPLELRDDFEIVKKAEAKGWKFNGADNGLCISNRIHSGSHPNYTEAVRQRLTALTRQFKGKLDSDAARAGLDDLVDELRTGLRKRRKKLD